MHSNLIDFAVEMQAWTQYFIFC